MRFFRYIVAALALTATGALAGNEPWTTQAPRGTTSAHQQMAIQAAQVHTQIAETGFDVDPRTIDWKREANRDSPVSNVTAAVLRKTITGRYHIYQDPGQTKWSVRYYAQNGDVYICRAGGRGRHQEVRQHYSVTPSAFGLYGGRYWGLTKSTPTGQNALSWPLVVDSSTGEIAIFNYYRRHWKTQGSGWIQREYAPAFAKNCPKLPRVNAVSNQTGDTIQEIARGARPIKIQPAFANSSRTPLTAGMYYHFNPPVR